MIVFVRYEQDNNQKFCISYKYTDSVPKTPVFAQNMPIMRGLGRHTGSALQ